jgi:hypothetical protein
LWINTSRFPSHEGSIPEICQKCDHFAAFAGVSAKYLGEREEELMKKRGRQTGKERFTIDASLCGRGDLLKALGSVASYLADRLFNLSNDTSIGLCHMILAPYLPGPHSIGSIRAGAGEDTQALAQAAAAARAYQLPLRSKR